VLGNLLAIPVLAQTANVYGVGSLHVPVWVDVAVPLAMCCLTGFSALLPALRAGRLSAVQAIAAGRAPRSGGGYAAHRLLGRLALPRPLTIGLAAPFARPARTAITLTAVLLGATAVTFAVGLGASLNRVANGLSHASAEPVQVLMPASGAGGIPVKNGSRKPAGKGGARTVASRSGLPTPAEAERAITAALRATPGTLRYVEETGHPISVAGLSQQVAATAFRGDARWTGYAMISGHWYTGPGQAVVGTGFLTDTASRSATPSRSSPAAGWFR
jgi:putative ABC transport system permease protein